MTQDKLSPKYSGRFTCCIKNKYPFEEATKILLLAFTPYLAND